jgi:hypothetical protein
VEKNQGGARAGALTPLPPPGSYDERDERSFCLACTDEQRAEAAGAVAAAGEAASEGAARAGVAHAPAAASRAPRGGASAAAAAAADADDGMS